MKQVVMKILAVLALAIIVGIIGCATKQSASTSPPAQVQQQNQAREQAVPIVAAPAPSSTDRDYKGVGNLATQIPNDATKELLENGTGGQNRGVTFDLGAGSTNVNSGTIDTGALRGGGTVQIGGQQEQADHVAGTTASNGVNGALSVRAGTLRIDQREQANQNAGAAAPGDGGVVGQGAGNQGPNLRGFGIGGGGFGAAGGGRGGGRAGGGGGGGGGGRGAAPTSIGNGNGLLFSQRGGAPARRGIDLPAQDEELWIITKPQQPVLAMGPDVQAPGTGALLAKLPDKPEQVPVPLKHTDVKASISGYIATVDVTQQYHNPFETKIEAVYVFPLPHNAAINEFLMTVGDRKIRGIIRERKEAEEIYQQARAQGYVASLLTQERPNIFTQSVANIEPGKQIDINIKYFHTLEYVDGWYEWVFPMVVGPRFNPSYSSDGIGAKAHGSAVGVTGQSTEISYLRPEQRSGHDISLSVAINAGVKIEQIESRNHQIASKIPDDAEATVKLDPSDSIPNKDFVLRYKIAGQTLKSAVMVQRDPKGTGGYFTLMLVPPDSMQNLPRQPLEMVFTLDVSGSMNGKPIEQSRAAIRYALTHMRPDDTFQVIRFFSQAEPLFDHAVPATKENVQTALNAISVMQAGGGTVMMEGIRKSLAVTRDPDRSRVVAFLTDGFIGNETEILREVHNSLGDSRIFSFGVGSSPNRYLLDHMAKMGAGAAAYLSLNDNADQIMAAYFERISHPALTDINVDYGSMQASNVYPQKVPDLFVGRPVILTGRFNGTGPTNVHVKGRFAGEAKDFTIPVKLDDTQSQHTGVASVWARMKIAALADESTWNDKENWPNSIKQVALDYGLMSAYTSFVAVDSSTQTAGGPGTAVAVPVPVPDGVRFDTTVQEK